MQWIMLMNEVEEYVSITATKMSTESHSML